MLHGRAPLVVFLAVLTCPLFAQPSSPASAETIEVSIINVDVVVTDRKGNRVYGLTRDDFAIREDGVPQPITNFAEYAPETKRADGTVAVDPHSVPAPAPVAPAPESKRTIIIFFDLVAHPSERAREVFASLREFVRKAVRPGDSASIVVFGKRMSTWQAFTHDTDVLTSALTAIEEMSIGVALRREDSIRRGVASDDTQAASLRSVSRSIGGEPLNIGEFERKSGGMLETFDRRRKVAGLTALMQSMSGIEGKKIVVAALDNFGLTVGSPSGAGAIGVDSQNADLRQSVVRAANANGVTLYPIYVPGMQYTNAPSAEDGPGVGMWFNSDSDLARFSVDNRALMNQTSAMFEIAQATGGLTAAGPSDIVELLPHVVDDLEAYYSLAYRATGAEGSRKVRVTTKNPDYEVRSRQAVIVKSDDTQMVDRVVSNLFHPVEYSLIPIRADLGRITRRGKLWSLPVSVRIPIAALTTRGGSGVATGEFSVFIASGSEFGVISDITRREQPYSIRHADLDVARRSHFTYDVTVDVDARASVVSIGVRDDVSKEFGMAHIPLPVQVSH